MDYSSNAFSKQIFLNINQISSNGDNISFNGQPTSIVDRNQRLSSEGDRSPSSSQSSWDTSYSNNLSPQWNPIPTVVNNGTFRDVMDMQTVPALPIYSNGAQLILKVAPESRFRYRYDTEMSGTHGSLQGARLGREKSVPTVELLNYSKSAIVRVSLVTCNTQGDRYPHPHSLFVKEKMYQKRYINIDNKKPTKTGHFIDPHYIRLGSHTNDYTAKFEKMCIISTKKEKFRGTIIEKLRLMDGSTHKEIDRKIEDGLKHADVDFVCLRFEAFSFDGQRIFESICPPLYSGPIANAKSAKTGKLKITKINTCSGSCRGGDAIWLLVEKINKKGLVVRFFEEDVQGQTIWEACVEGDQLELHHQYAIIFHTPPYRDTDLNRDHPVSMRLERRELPFDWSESETFVYEPYRPKVVRDDAIYRKESVLTSTKRPAVADLSSATCVPCKRRTENDALPFPYNLPSQASSSIMECDQSGLNTNQLIQDLLNMSSAELATLASFANNMEDSFQNFLPLDNLLEKDAPSGHGDLVNKLGRKETFMLCYLIARSKIVKEQQLNNVTEQISKLNVLKADELSLQGAANTLLVLKSGILIKTKIMSLVESGDLENLKKTIDCDVDLEETDEFGNTPLHKAVLLKNKEILNILLNDVTCLTWLDRPNKKGETPIIIASRNGESEIVQLLVKAGADMKGRLLFNECKPEEFSKICDILNTSGKWKDLADLLELSFLISSAENSDSPAHFLFHHIEEKDGLDWKVIRHLLDILEIKKAVEIIDCEFLSHRI